MKSDIFTDLHQIFLRYTNDGTIVRGAVDLFMDNSSKVAIQKNLNELFPDSTCVDVLFTRNTDNMFFGVYVTPTILSTDLPAILLGSEPMKFNRYTVELDSKLFSVGLEPAEITALLLQEVSALIASENPIWNLRGILDLYQAELDSSFAISTAADNAQLLIFGIKDTLNKLTSCLYSESNYSINGNEFITANEMEEPLGNALKKILSSTFGLFDIVRPPKVSVLQWVLNIYMNADINVPSAINTLKDAKNATGSVLINTEIDKTIRSLYRINTDIALESARIVTEAKRGGFFDSMKQNGLRAIEDDLYEFRVRSKNADNEDDAMYTLRQINTRLNIIEEYLYTNENTLSPAEVDRWRNVAAKYRELREELSRKTMVKKKQYGIFIDYDMI